MHEEDLKDMKCIEEILEKDLRAELKKVKDAGSFSPGQTKTISEAVDLMLKMKEYEEWLEGQGMSDMSRRNMARSYGYSNGSGQFVSNGYPGNITPVSYIPRNPVNGQFISNGYPGNYSGHSTRDRMVAALEDVMGQCKNEYEAKMVMDAINQIQSSSH